MGGKLVETVNLDESWREGRLGGIVPELIGSLLPRHDCPIR